MLGCVIGTALCHRANRSQRTLSSSSRHFFHQHLAVQQGVGTLHPSESEFTSFSRAVSQYMGTAMICLAWLNSVVLYWVVSPFLARPVEWKCYSAEQEDSLRPLFKAIVYSRSWVRKSANRPGVASAEQLCDAETSERLQHGPDAPASSVSVTGIDAAVTVCWPGRVLEGRTLARLFRASTCAPMIQYSPK